MNNLAEGFIWGAAGAISIDVAKIIALRFRAREEVPRWLTSSFYWKTVLLVILLGGLLVLVHLRSGSTLTPWAEWNLGASVTLAAVAGGRAFPKQDLEED